MSNMMIGMGIPISHNRIGIGILLFIKGPFFNNLTPY